MVKTAMAGEHRIRSLEVISDSAIVNFGSNGSFENSVHHITVRKLNGKNYLQWSQLVIMYICGRGKDDYITGLKTALTKNDASYKTWFFKNNMILS